MNLSTAQNIIIACAKVFIKQSCSRIFSLQIKTQIERLATDKRQSFMVN